MADTYKYRHPAKWYPWMTDYVNAYRLANQKRCSIRMINHRYVVVLEGDNFYQGNRYTAKQLQTATQVLLRRAKYIS